MTDELRRPSELSPEQSRIRQATEAIRAMADEVADGLPTKRRMSAKLRQITLLSNHSQLRSYLAYWSRNTGENLVRHCAVEPTPILSVSPSA